ncbi:unnamed protein product [Mytilus coruscus]|uniref:Integrase p58-like C-terminal domain-containing protein n=1 Tax=Mytilus coruscus TaxID=42192 RepID=A0A6J8EH72_MYTCO|nr:unnamed protein product [Mytilus coruscus]
MSFIINLIERVKRKTLMYSQHTKIVRVCTRSKDYGCSLNNSQNEKDSPVKEINFENVSESQLSDDVISIIIQWKIDEVKPTWAGVSHMSPEVKFYWSRLNSLIFVNGILYKKSESYNGKHYDLHIALPANFKRFVLNQVLNTVTAYELSQNLDVIHQFARNKLKLSSVRMKINYDIGTKMQIFNAGDLVWLLNTRRVKRLCPKLQNNWKGPYIVVNKLNDVIFRIQRGRKTNAKVVTVYTCGICHDYSFDQSIICTRHMTEQHSGFGYRCNECCAVVSRRAAHKKCDGKLNLLNRSTMTVLKRRTGSYYFRGKGRRWL